MEFPRLVFVVLLLLFSVVVGFKVIRQSDQECQNFFYIYDTCESSEEFDIEIQSNFYPKVIIRCFPFPPFPIIPDGPKQIAHFGPKRFTHIFLKIGSEWVINYWKELYGHLSITKFKNDFFHFASEAYTKYPHYDPDVFKLSYWKSQWNQDKFIVKDAYDMFYKSLAEYEELPTDLQSQTNYGQPIHNLEALLYSTLSGWAGSRCSFYTWQHKLSELTFSYNAFDQLFCEVFSYYNLTFQANYNFEEFAYMRPFLLRDDLISSFPPDPDAVFYESPGITFVVLKEPPIQWDNITRPFTPFVWIAVILGSLFIYLVSKLFSPKVRANLKRGGFTNIFTTGSESTPEGQYSEAARVWNLFVKIFRFLVTAAYSGMILGGFLNPSYPWTPKTFKELNESTGFYAAAAYDTAVDPEYLKRSHMLNGLKKWKPHTIGNETHPIIYWLPGQYLVDDENDRQNRYALLTYDDKKYLNIYSRNQMGVNAKYIHQLETEKEVVLKEMRYISVYAGATKLHFLIKAIRRCFETGSWQRWKYLENNYFKYVAPYISERYGAPPEPSLLRSLNTLDILSIVYVLAFGSFCSAIILLSELVTKVGKPYKINQTTPIIIVSPVK